MQVPLWLQRATRTGTSPGLLLATAVCTAVFTATPLALGSIAERFDVGRGTAGLFSAAQLGFFVITTWAAGRFLVPDRGLFRTGLAVLSAANLASVVIGQFVVFVLVRAVAGASLGLLTWLAWSQVFGDDDRQGDVAVIGPITGVVASPVLGLLLQLGDDRAMFAALAGVGIVPLLFTPDFQRGAARSHGTRTRPVPQAALLIATLTVMTLGGSAVFVYGGVILADEHGLSPVALSLAFACNAVAGLPSARWRGGRPWAGVWLVVTAGCAVALGVAGEVWVAWAAITLWGFAFWAGVPGVFSLLSARSAHPTERAGDAQAAMAAGRAVGPLLGGAVVNATSYRGLGLVGGVLMAVAGLAALAVEADRGGIASRHG